MGLKVPAKSGASDATQIQPIYWFTLNWVALQDCQIAGNSLELLILNHGGNTHGGRANSPGYSKNSEDWTIRSQVLNQKLKSQTLVYIMSDNGEIYGYEKGGKLRYIGQTKYTKELRERMRNSEYKRYLRAIEDGSLDSYRGSRALYNAFHKYGREAFTLVTLLRCPIDQLNQKEDEMITAHNTLSPNGYNLMTGGGVGRIMSDDTRAYMSVMIKIGIETNIDSYRKHAEELEGLPVHVVWFELGNARGFRVYMHPLCTSKRFVSKSKSLDILKDEVYQFLDTLTKTGVKYKSNQMLKKDKGIPKGINPRAHGSYEVAFMYKKQLYTKCFHGDCAETNLQQASEWNTKTRNQLRHGCSSETKCQSAESEEAKASDDNA